MTELLADPIPLLATIAALSLLWLSGYVAGRLETQKRTAR